ncbi:MAG: hypothetical protein U0575_14050 [Phycisphaerales bacterium]
MLIVARLLMAGKGVMLAVSKGPLHRLPAPGAASALFPLAATFGSIPITLSLSAFLAFNPSCAVYALAGAPVRRRRAPRLVRAAADRPSDLPRGGWDVPGIALFRDVACAPRS